MTSPVPENFDFTKYLLRTIGRRAIRRMQRLVPRTPRKSSAWKPGERFPWPRFRWNTRTYLELFLTKMVDWSSEESVRRAYDRAMRIGAATDEARSFSTVTSYRGIYDCAAMRTNESGLIRFQPWITRDVKPRVQSLGLTKGYHSMHVRRGDTLIMEAAGTFVPFGDPRASTKRKMFRWITCRFAIMWNCHPEVVKGATPRDCYDEQSWDVAKVGLHCHGRSRNGATGARRVTQIIRQIHCNECMSWYNKFCVCTVVKGNAFFISKTVETTTLSFHIRTKYCGVGGFVCFGQIK